MHTTPRPILKRTSSSPSAERHVVHFPPSPALTRTFAAHSPATYDRSPIVVAPNACALPERGGRTYVLDDSPSPCSSPRKRSSSKSGRLLHPRAIENNKMPTLIPDISSESDESDGFPSPHLGNQEFFFGPANPHGLKSSDDAVSALAFLPYPPSHPDYSSSEDDAHSTPSRRRKERKNEASRDNNRIRSSSAADEAVVPCRRSSRMTSTSPPSPMFASSFSLCDSFSSFGLRDDSCLGGF